jgi:hypothetical protein
MTHSLPTPSEQDICFYREHGYFVTGPIFSVQEISAARRGIERYLAGERDWKLPIPYFGGAPLGEGLWWGDYLSLQIREVRELIHKPILAKIAQRLCGSTAVRLWHDQAIVKPPHRAGTKGSVGWHTDRVTWRTCSSLDMLTAWIPLTDVDRHNGTLLIVEGSHRWPDNDGIMGFHRQDLDTLAQRVKTHGSPWKEVPIEVKRGQVSYHHVLTVHGSRPNLSSEPRLSLSVHLQDAANHYVERLGEDGQPLCHRNDMLARLVDGRPDYADPRFFPLLGQDGAPEQSPADLR